jgi:O-acetyl-ADP-ribose deacetylase (regulator of RNase III)/uncharacterized protein YwgA
MLKFTTGNIVKSQVEAIVNTVNTQGVMGKGIALAFKLAFPKNFTIYEKACKEGKVEIGKLLITETGEMFPKYIINFPTKIHWRYPSKYKYIEDGLKDLLRIIKEYNIKSIAIPPLGSGNGRLDWHRVKKLLETYLSDIESDIEITIFEPGYNDQISIKPKTVELTTARAIFLYVLKHYQILGYRINLLVAQKIAYLIQRLGEPLKLSFVPGTYGPYSNNLNHLLKLLNNSFISYDQNDNSPGTVIEINLKRFDKVENYFNDKLTEEQKERTNRLLNLIEGFESPFGLELLATVDFIVQNKSIQDVTDIENEIGSWTQRKRDLMKPHHIKVAYKRLKEFDLV